MNTRSFYNLRYIFYEACCVWKYVYITAIIIVNAVTTNIN